MFRGGSYRSRGADVEGMMARKGRKGRRRRDFDGFGFLGDFGCGLGWGVEDWFFLDVYKMVGFGDFVGFWVFEGR